MNKLAEENKVEEEVAEEVEENKEAEAEVVEEEKVDQEDPIEAWRQHNANLETRTEFLNKKNFKYY